MEIFGENGRFWLPILILAAITTVSTRKVILSHLYLEKYVDKRDMPKYSYSRRIEGRRGTIYDAFGKSYPIAKSVPYWEYHLDPVALTNAVVKPLTNAPPRSKKAIVKTIAAALRLDRDKVMAMADNTRNRFQPLGVSADPQAHSILTDRKWVAGIVTHEKQVRQYPLRRHMCHIIGSVQQKQDNKGAAGIEATFNHVLKGTPGGVECVRDAHGHELYDRRRDISKPEAGSDVYLTIDHNLQFEVEKAIEWGVEKYTACAAWGIVMDANTGAILAMATLPDFDPCNFPAEKDPRQMNRAIGFNYEPGSVMKVITAAAAIDCGLVSPGTTYDTRRNDPNYYNLPGDGSHTWKPRMSIADAIVHSSNIVIGKLGCDLGQRRLWNYLKAFGFSKKTGIELPGEGAGILKDWKDWDRTSWSRVPIGHAVSVTAIQLVSAYQAIANDGRRMKPYIVSKIVKSTGEEIFTQYPMPIGNPIRAATARQMRRIMTGVAASGGTAHRAALKGYSIAGKTGTAQKLINKRYSDTLYVATFCGMVPADEPKVIILASLDFDQRTKYHQGGNSSGLVFKRIAAATMRYLMIPPDLPEQLEADGSGDTFDEMMKEERWTDLNE